MSLFKNASPEYILLGADDKGARMLPSVRDPLPQHVPLIYMFAQKGTTNKIFAGGARAALNYGTETFNPDSKYHTHTTELLSSVMGAGNACSIKRVIPTDAGPAASVVLYVDIIADQVDNFTRDGLGNKVVQGQGFAIDATTPKIAGHRIKFITEIAPNGGTPGTLTTKAGTMTVGANTSTMYPILEHHAAYQGEYYHNIGYSIDSILDGSIDTVSMAANKAMIYNLSLVTRSVVGGTPQVLRTLFGSPSVNFSLKQGSTNPTTTTKMDTKSVFDANWFNETDPLLPVRFNDYAGLHVYSANVDLVLNSIMALEAPHITAGNSAWYDFTTTVQSELLLEKDLLNLFSGKSSKNIEHFTMVMDTTTPTLTVGQKEVHMSKNTPIFLEGGSDGTLSDTMLETLVVTEMKQYLDPNSTVIDNATNVETHIYDSGFSLPTKLELFNFIAVRKDTVVVAGTHVYSAGSIPIPLADVRASAVLLKTRAKLFPESDFFGTPVSRAVIMSGAYKLYASLTGEYYPLSFELAVKSAQMMSAGNYKWNATYNFDHGANAVLSQGHSYEPSFIPAGVKPLLWASGMVWAQPKDRTTYFIPAVQTVYPDDTSPMNTWYTICALATLNRIASDSWREFTGTSSMTDAVFKDAVLNYLNTRLLGIFDGILVVVPEVIITAEDATRGYSWQVMFKLYAANMKTKMVSYTEVYRLNDLTVA